LIFARGTGVYDGKGGNDAIVADLSAMTDDVRFVAGSGLTYNYLGSSFANFESFLISTGDGDDYIDAHVASAANHLVLANGDNWALTGPGSDYISTGSGTDWVESGAGNDYVDVREGPSNYVDAGPGNDTVMGGAGIDIVEARTGSDAVVTAAGEDVIRIVVDGTDTVSAGADNDRLSIDASAFNTGGGGSIWWGNGKDAAGNVVPGVDVNSPWEYILGYAQNAKTSVLQMSNSNTGNTGNGVVYASLTFADVEQLDITGSAVVPGGDLIFARGTGVYDGKGGNDAIVADLSAMTDDVRFVAGSGLTYNYLGSSFANFESFLISTGDGDDYIDAHVASAANHLVLANGDNWALTGPGSDYISTGSGTDWVESGAGNDYVDVREGPSNYVDAGPGNDTVMGGAGIDIVEARTGSDAVVTAAGEDVIRIVVDGTDTVSAGADNDRLSIDASAFNTGGGGSIWWGNGKDAAGNVVPGVDVNSPWEYILGYAQNAKTSVLQMSNSNTGNTGNGVVYASLTFADVEQLDITGSAVVPGGDLIFARGTGVYDGKGGNDAIVADLSAMTDDVRFVAGSGLTYNYLGSSFANFESFLISTGDGDDYIDSSSVSMQDWLSLGAGNDFVRLGGGNDVADGGSGSDQFDAGPGNDILTGGSGPDVFQYAAAGNGTDTISDFGSGDVIQIAGVSLNSGSFVASGANLAQNKVNISSSGGVTTVLVGTDATPGADVTILLTGNYPQSTFVANGTSISLVTANHPPTGAPTAVLANGFEDTSYPIVSTTLLQGFSDSDGDSLAVTGLGASHGTLTANADNSWTFVPTANYNGPVSLTFSVIDGQGGSLAATQSFTVAPVNDPPLGLPTAVLSTGNEDVTYTLFETSLLEGFSDADGDALSVVSLEVTAGNLADNLDGTWSFTPQANYYGDVIVDYEVVDGQGGRMPVVQSFSLSPVNDAPRLAQALPDAAASAEQAFQYVVSPGAFADVDGGDVLTLSATRANGSPLPAWLVFDPILRMFSGTPGTGDAGVLALRVTASDLAGLTAQDDFQITVSSANSTPLASDDEAVLAKNGNVLIPVRANDTDADADPLLVVAVTQGAHGTVVIDAVTGNPKYTPARSFIGSDAFTYTVIDGQGGKRLCDGVGGGRIAARRRLAQCPDRKDGRRRHSGSGRGRRHLVRGRQRHGRRRRR
jgi:Ca2+-binding RTX toxin-like protein